MIALLAGLPAPAAQDAVAVGAFSLARPGGALPAGWEPLAVGGAGAPTVYTLVEADGTTVVRADARASASGLVRRIRALPANTPILRWRWKVDNVLERSDLRTKAGDDYPARLCVLFDYPLDRLTLVERAIMLIARLIYGDELPAAALCYVWDTRAPAGTIVPSAYTRRVRLVVAESGAARVRQWIEVARDIPADFRAAFGEDAPPVSGIAIATDTDNTGETAVAWYGDISLHAREPSR